MASSTAGSSCYPPKPVTLSPEDERTIEMLADRLVVETLHASENFTARGRVADPRCWKSMKKKDSMVVYQEVANSRQNATRGERLWSEDTVVISASPRPAAFDLTTETYQVLQGEDASGRFQGIRGTCDFDDDKGVGYDTFTKFGARAGTDDQVLQRFLPDNVPTIFSAGTFPGTVEDMALAFFADSDERTRTRFSSNKDVAVDDLKILARIHGPTKEDPFRFLGIKWYTNVPRWMVSLVVKPRDYLIIESTGMAFDSNGDRFTYMLNHSIEMDEVPDFRAFGLVRMVFSACHIMRPYETKDAAVKIFSRGFLLINGSFGVRGSAAQLAEGFVGIPRMVEEAYSRKLSWILENRCRLSVSSANGTVEDNSFSSSNRSSKAPGEKSSTCPCCHMKMCLRRGSLLPTSKGECNLCHQTVCHKCTVKKLLPIEGSRGRQVKTKELEFCLNCYLKAKRLSAWQVALAMLSSSSP
uniref:Uncharacterized protein n=1 Tax=Peronospora matthiolae TaxID=2874970 RepID=A0AAV1TZY6_9STRA